MTAKKTHAQYLQELFLKEIDYNPIEEYNGTFVKILHECAEGHVWDITPHDILKGRGCPDCWKTRITKTHEQYVKECPYEVLEPYKGADVRIKHKCSKNHEPYEWLSGPSDILKGQGCKKCANLNNKGVYNEKFFIKNPDIGDQPGILYCVILVNKKTLERECIKIGITKGTSYKDVARRSLGFKGYETRVQKIVRGRLEDVYYLEAYLHELWQHKRYYGSHVFGGHTELFELDDKIIRSIPDTV